MNFSGAAEVNATVSHRSSRSASPANELEIVTPRGEIEDGARVEFPLSCEKPATPDVILPVVRRSESESPAAVESDEEILIVEREGVRETATGADRSSPVRKACQQRVRPKGFSSGCVSRLLSPEASHAT